MPTPFLSCRPKATAPAELKFNYFRAMGSPRTAVVCAGSFWFVFLGFCAMGSVGCAQLGARHCRWYNGFITRALTCSSCPRRLIQSSVKIRHKQRRFERGRRTVAAVADDERELPPHATENCDDDDVLARLLWLLNKHISQRANACQFPIQQLYHPNDLDHAIVGAAECGAEDLLLPAA